MFGISPLTAAYGRSYRSKAEIQKDLDGNKDFMTSGGQYINKEQLLEAMPGHEINVRYGKNNSKVCVVKFR